MPRRGRKAVPIDLEELEKLRALQCTDEEISAWFGLSRRGLERRKAQTRRYDFPIRNAKGSVVRADRLTFREIYDRGQQKGKVSVRRTLFALAQGGKAGAATAAIFLAKNLLDYTDKASLEHSGEVRLPVQTLSDEELWSQIATLSARLGLPEPKPTQLVRVGDTWKAPNVAPTVAPTTNEAAAPAYVPEEKFPGEEE